MRPAAAAAPPACFGTSGRCNRHAMLHGYHTEVTATAGIQRQTSDVTDVSSMEPQAIRPCQASTEYATVRFPSHLMVPDELVPLALASIAPSLGFARIRCHCCWRAPHLHIRLLTADCCCCCSQLPQRPQRLLLPLLPLACFPRHTRSPARMQYPAFCPPLTLTHSFSLSPFSTGAAGPIPLLALAIGSRAHLAQPEHLCGAPRRRFVRQLICLTTARFLFLRLTCCWASVRHR